MDDVAKLQSLFGHQFENQSLLLQALTHRSAGSKNNERLEFLGDSVLGVLVSDNLYGRFDAATEGQLSRTRSSIVKETTLARIARSLDLGAHLKLGSGELKSGGFNRDSILSDALEAILGAVYLDGGLDAAKSFVAHHFAEELSQADPSSVEKDPKTRLQEHLQKHGLQLPDYDVVTMSGSSHAQVFEVNCHIPSSAETYTGHGSSKRKAEQMAASKALLDIIGEALNG
jgi:ribonuclease III